MALKHYIISRNMRLRIVNDSIEIPKLNPEERMVHLAFRASNVDILKLMQRCPMLRAIQVPPSHRKAMSNALQVFLEMQGIELLEGEVLDNKNNPDEYFTVDEATLEEIRALIASGMGMDDVASRIQERAGISQSLIKYRAKAITNAA
jgi:hypothetical protein